MFEVIGIAVVAWFAFLIIRGILRAKKGSTSTEFGLEARRIATQELFVPDQYYNYITTNHMDDLKQQAFSNARQFGRIQTNKLAKTFGAKLVYMVL